MLNTKHIKALFFDIDGTLVSFNTHKIPQSTVEALEQAKHKGTKIFISTGRPVSFINNLRQIEHLIDGYITTNGAYCFIGNEVVCTFAIQPSDVDTILNAAKRFQCPAVVVGSKRIAAYLWAPELDEVFKKGLNLKDFTFAPIEEVRQMPILQISPFFSPEQENEVMPQLQHCTSGRWTNKFTDITNSDADKGKALITMTHTLHIDINETMAFGDGGNDIPIIRNAGVGVAMGNGGDNVKQAADYVTTSVDDNGVQNALQHYGVI